MRKTTKTIMTGVLAGVIGLTCVGCGGDKNPNADNPDALHIRVFDGGYSTSWLTEIIKAFEAETGISVDLKSPTNNTANWLTEIESKVSPIDLYFDQNSGMDIAGKTGFTVNGVKYDSYLADLTDMYNTKVPGEDVLYKDKMIDSLENALNFDYTYDYDTKTYSLSSETGKYSTTSWANGSLSFVVNMEKWDSAWGNFPNTTDELFALCGRIMGSNTGKNVSEYVYPFVYSLPSSYWSFVYETWAKQYMGIEYDDYVNGYDASGERFTKELLRYDGFKQALQMVEESIKARGADNSGCYSYPYSTSIDFTTAQFYLLNGKGIMQPNGNWLISEMAANYANAADMNIQFKKVPVISSIKDRCSSIADDAELSALISAIDDGTTALQGTGYDVNQEDFNRVAAARKVVVSMGNTHGAYIPAYAKNADKAKQFLLFMAKDSSIETYYKETMGSTLPFKYDYSKVDYTPSKFIQSEATMLQDSELQYTMTNGTNSKYRFFSQTGFNGMFMPNYVTYEAEAYLSAVTVSDRKTAEQIFDDNYKYAQNNWNTYAPYTWD